MNLMLKALSELCKKNLLEEKIIIARTYTDGLELCQALVQTDGGYLNLQTETFAGLAHKQLEDTLYKKKLTPISGHQELLLIEEIILNLVKEERLGYFFQAGETPGLIPAIARSIAELRQGGINDTDLDTSAFVNKEKGNDLKLILKQYQTMLKNRNYIDQAALLKHFISWVTDNHNFLDNRLFIIPGFWDLNSLEKRIVEALAAEILPPVLYNRLNPAGSGYESKQLQDCSSQYLPAGEESESLFKSPYLLSFVPGHGLELFHAYGIYNEAREVIRRIYSRDIPFDQVVVAYLSPEYISVFRHLAAELGFSITAAEGFPLNTTNPGKAAIMLLHWFFDDYSLKALKPLLLEGCIKTSQNTEIRLYPQEVLNLLRRTAVGKGREQYNRLQQEACRYQEEAAELSPDNPRRQTIIYKQAVYKEAHKYFHRLMNNFPVADNNGEINFSQLVSALLEAVGTMAAIRNDEDAQALQTIENVFSDIKSLANRTYTLEKAWNKLLDILNNLRVGTSVSRPGALHLLGYERLMYTNRYYTFIAGLDSHSFPGRTGQDPILLDKERVEISDLLKKQEEKPRRKELLMGAALSSRPGRTCLSYSSYDPTEGRKNYPSSMLLRVLRLKKEDPGLDYTDLAKELGQAVGYSPAESKICLDELEWWLTQILHCRTKNLEEVLGRYFPGIQRGIKAYQARYEAVITGYDGQIKVLPGELDPRVNKTITVSCSRLEMMAKCPFKYFVSQVLGAKPPEENIPDQHQWLDPMQRGSLLHRIYQEFMSYIILSREKVSYKFHRDLMEKIAFNLIKEYRTIITPPSEAVYRYEVEQILLCCGIFLKCEEENQHIPVCLEASFGLGQDAVNQAVGGCPEPLTIALSKGHKLQIKGIIDRIDHLQDNCYAVWDYKTGSTYGYSEKGYLVQGKQIQHALYTLAAEQILKRQGIQNPVVSISGYYFPSDKGEGQRFYRKRRKPDELFRVITLLCDLMAEGQFLAADSTGDCTFCEYQQVCGYQLATRKVAGLIEDDNLTGLEKRKELISLE